MAIYFDRPVPSTQWRTIGNQLVNLDNVRMFEVVGDANESSVRVQYSNGDLMILYTDTAAACQKFLGKLSDQLRG
jgi:hypothetical protein